MLKDPCFPILYKRPQTSNFLYSPPLLSEFAAQTPFPYSWSFFPANAARRTSNKQCHPAILNCETSSRTAMASSDRRAKTTIEPPSLAAAPIGEEPGGLFLQQQKHGDGATSCLPLRQKNDSNISDSTQRAAMVSTDSSQLHRATSANAAENKVKITTQFRTNSSRHLRLLSSPINNSNSTMEVVVGSFMMLGLVRIRILNSNESDNKYDAYFRDEHQIFKFKASRNGEKNLLKK
ncbi:hypothetical protein H5410_003117 [Solanum commersonii]|uniref:Uncharacterized protein n=1 Tax=Solanum commersonii TaxID=4109 RepID=A0A9J6B454_SOLCO|nr:hypothetical protein H5410_003117 [Solanum commersonii]